jgi:RNA polymerase sigma-70 factor (sigma-E family)
MEHGAVRGRAGVSLDDTALASFCREEFPRLVGLLSLYCGDAHLAEELAQEALLRMCERWDSAGQLDSPQAWVTRVALNLARSRFRRRAMRRRVVARMSSWPMVAQDDPNVAAQIAVRQAVADLPERQRTALVLRYYADLSVDAVAAAMGCPNGTVKTLTAQAIASLRRAGLEFTDA